MFRCTTIAFSLAGVILGFSTSARALDGIALTNQDSSMGSLAEMAEGVEKGAGTPFLFPPKVKDQNTTYGVDISHYNTGIPWRSLKDLGIDFVYIKSSEGARKVDKKFEGYWKNASDAHMLKGAYHFVAANIDYKAQAANFLSELEAVDSRSGTDLPPVLDVEWDCKRDASNKIIINPATHRCFDKWSDLTVKEIETLVSELSKGVEAKTGVVPIIYTHPEWIRSMGLEKSSLLKNNLIWIADFKSSSVKNDSPRVPPGVSPLIWQFSDNAKITPSCDVDDKDSQCTDVSKVRLSLQEFRKRLHLQ